MLENERKHTSVFCLSGVGYRKAFNLATFQCFTPRLWTPSRVLSKNDLDFKYSPRCNWLEPTRANKFKRKVQSTKLKRDKKASIIGIIGADLFFAVYSYITHGSGETWWSFSTRFSWYSGCHFYPSFCWSFVWFSACCEGALQWQTRCKHSDVASLQQGCGHFLSDWMTSIRH